MHARLQRIYRIINPVVVHIQHLNGVSIELNQIHVTNLVLPVRGIG